MTTRSLGESGKKQAQFSQNCKPVKNDNSFNLLQALATLLPAFSDRVELRVCLHFETSTPFVEGAVGVKPMLRISNFFSNLNMGTNASKPNR